MASEWMQPRQRAQRVTLPKVGKPKASYYVPVAERRGLIERHAAEMRDRPGRHNGIMARARALKGWGTRRKGQEKTHE